jgi:hypothetical protein
LATTDGIPGTLFSDPLAARLAGEQGEAIAAMAPRHMRSGWPMIIRTRLIDDRYVSADAALEALERRISRH